MALDPKGMSDAAGWVEGSEIAEFDVLLRLVVAPSRRC
jgi:hypothetical protein